MLLLIVASWCVLPAHALAGKEGVPVSFPYVFVMESGSSLPSKISDDDFYSLAQGVIFPVNQFYIPDGSAWLRELKEKVEPWATANGYELRRVEMRGASSPEGPIAWNNTLAANRSIALRDTLRSIFHVGYSLIDPNVVENPEDYKALVHMMRQKKDPDLAYVVGVLEKYAGNRLMIKAELMGTRQGALWQRLLREYFPEIRYARVLLHFAPKSDEPVTDELSDEEAFRMLHEKYPYVFVLPPGVKKVPKLSDNFYYNYGQGIIFPVNKFDLPKNHPWFDELIYEVEPWARENKMILRKADMRGASSPEGPIKWNNTLAENRSRALQDTLQSIFHIDYNIVDSAVMQAPEDYRALLHLMRRERDRDLRIVEDILEKYNWDRVLVKRSLKKVNGGKLWRRLLKEYYPNIRYARVYLFFSQDLDSISSTKRERVPQSTRMQVFPDTIYEPQRVPRRRVLAIRTNLLYDGLYMPGYGWAPSPNVAVEYFPSKGRFTYNAEITYPDWEEWPSQHQFWQIHDYNLGVRCYTRPRKKAPCDGGDYGFLAADYFMGFFLGAYVHAGRYGIGFNDHKGWEGEYFGGGLQVGYTMPLGSGHRWRLEFTASAGFFQTNYDPYIFGNPVTGEKDDLYYYDWAHSADLFKKRNYLFTWLGPTGIGVHLTYDLLYKRHKKKGVSTRRWETIQVPVIEPIEQGNQDQPEEPAHK